MSREPIPPAALARSAPWQGKRRAVGSQPQAMIDWQQPDAGTPVWQGGPAVAGIDLVGLAAADPAVLLDRLDAVGAVLLRGFAVDGEATFSRLLAALFGPLMQYEYASTPRTALGQNIYTSTEYPSDLHIPLHNEMSYAATAPRFIGFCCLVAAKTGGETPLADSAAVLARLPPDLVDKFERLGVSYMRNYGGGLDLSWQKAFGVDSRAEVEARCAMMGIQTLWHDEGRLTTCETRPATRHNAQAARVWFNQAHLFHHSSLPSTVLAAVASGAIPAVPRDACFGDGTPIANAEVALIRDAYAAETVSFGWEPGDLLLLDNLRIAHGRRPFDGKRRVIVGMGGPG